MTIRIKQRRIKKPKLATMPTIPHWDRYRNTAIGQYQLQQEQRFIRQVLGTAEPSLRLLELCSCTGRVTLPLEDITTDVTGVDIDFAALQMFHQSAGRPPAVMADAQTLPFAAQSFDCVVALQCFRYFDSHRFLANCHRVLCHGGWLIMQAVNDNSYKRRLKKLLRGAANQSPSQFMTTDDLLYTINSFGFTVQHICGYNWAPFVPDITRLSNSPLVWVAANLEKRLLLDRCYRLSPWVLVAAQKDRGI